MTKLQVFSEIGKLKKVMLHRPGKELLNLTPDLLEELLFDDIPSLEDAQREHDNFKQIFIDNGVEVVYLKDAFLDTISFDFSIRNRFIDQFLREANLDEKIFIVLKEYFSSLDNETLVDKAMSGVTASELRKLGYEIESDNLFALYPIPNLYFMRDCFTSIHNTVSLNSMYSETRKRETIFIYFIFNYNPEYFSVAQSHYRDEPNCIEGGDILIINEHTLIVGISQRTTKEGIKDLLRGVSKKTDINRIVAFEIPSKRSFMHLDTVFTQLDEDAYIVHPEILENLKFIDFRKNGDEITESELKLTLKEVLDDITSKDVKVFYCGGDDMVASQREQWSDGANTLVIEPGRAIVYKRNTVTNNLLKEAGFEVLEFDGSNLGVGRGGPRCMSMPLVREK